MERIRLYGLGGGPGEWLGNLKRPAGVVFLVLGSLVPVSLSGRP